MHIKPDEALNSGTPVNSNVIDPAVTSTQTLPNSFDSNISMDNDCFSIIDSSDGEVWSDCGHELVDSEDEPEVEDERIAAHEARDPYFDFGALEVAVYPTQEEIDEDLKTLECERLQVIERGEDEDQWAARVMSRQREVPSWCPIDGVDDKHRPGFEIIGSGEWVRVRGGMTLDSGCSVFVMPSKWLRHLALEPSEGSKRGQKFVAASNHSMQNEGQRTVRFRTQDGSRRQMVFQVAAVNKILASIAGICDNGNTVLFRQDGGTIRHVQTGRETEFRRQGNVYVMDMWIRNPKHTPTSKQPMDFARPGRGK